MESSSSDPRPSTSTSTAMESQHRSVYSPDIFHFGAPSDLGNDDCLPTNGDVIRYYYLLMEEELGGKKYLSTSYTTYTPFVVNKIIEIWEKLPIPIINRKSVFNKLNKFVTTYKDESKRKNRTSFLEFTEKMTDLFDISKCRCNIIDSTCSCKNESDKIPICLKEFIIDQRTNRIHKINQYIQMSTESSTSTTEATVERSSDKTYAPTHDVNMENAENFEHVAIPRYTPRQDLPNFSRECDRYRVSARAAAALASAILQDYGVKDDNEQPIIIDKNKVTRQRTKWREEVLRRRTDKSLLKVFSFDSRKDETITALKIGDKMHPRVIREPHMVIVREPHSQYIGFVALKGETAEIKAKALINFFNEQEIPINELFGVSCDGEAVNTGCNNGIIRRIELHLSRPLHWFVCMLHLNELPFRHLYDSVEKATSTGPRTSTGVLAPKLNICETLQVNWGISFVLFNKLNFKLKKHAN